VKIYRQDKILDAKVGSGILPKI